MKIGFVGLGKMGYQIVSKLLLAGHEVVAFDVNEEARQRTQAVGANIVNSPEDLVAQLGDNPIVWLMIPAEYTGVEISKFSQLLPEGAVLIDGGNTHFTDTLKHAQLLQEKGIQMVDVGTSGGVLGQTNGFSLMVGGSKDLYMRLLPLFDALAQPKGAHALVGGNAYGHYVKMVHNGVEYGMMQALAEGYDLLKSGPLPDIPLADVADVWQKGSIVQSSLNDLATEILRINPELVGIDGFVADSGEGRWTLEAAEQSGLDMPVLRSSMAVRQDSQQGNVSYATKLLAALRNKFGGHNLNKE